MFEKMINNRKGEIKFEYIELGIYTYFNTTSMQKLKERARGALHHHYIILNF
jgi:hypothetical protein